MNIRYTNEKSVAINLKEHIEDAIEMFGEDLGSKVSSFAGNWLFKTNDKARKLSKEKTERFHLVTQKLLWISQRGQPDAVTAISFLVTRVYNPDVEDWKKLK